MRSPLLLAASALSATAVACWALLGADPAQSATAPEQLPVVSVWRWRLSGNPVSAAAALSNSTTPSPAGLQAVEAASGWARRRRLAEGPSAGQRLLAAAGVLRRALTRRRLREHAGATGPHRGIFSALVGSPAAAASEQENAMPEVGGAQGGKPWLEVAPHLPAPAMEEACYNAAYTDGATGNAAGTIILTSGNKFMLGRLLPRFLKAAKQTLTGDVSNHVVVVALGPSARNVCSGLKARYSHQCVEDPAWEGPEGQYDIGDEWFAAVSMNKLELVLNAMTLGYSVLWMDLDVVMYRNPLPYLIGLGADVAVPNSGCAATRDEAPLRAGAPLEQDTGLLFADANPRALRFVYDWLRVQRHYRHKLAVEPTLAHDGAILNLPTAPHIQNAFEGQKPLVRIHQLSQDRFSSWCTGPCGCQGTQPVTPVKWAHEEDDEDEGVSAGELECPEEAMEERLTMHLSCAKSLAEKEVLVDIIHAEIEDIRPVDDFIMN